MGTYDCPACNGSAFTSYPKTGTRQCNDCGASRPIEADRAGAVASAPACGNCRFARFGQYQKEDLRECRRRSPTSPAWWPSVRIDAWCGEYQREES